MQIQYFMQNKKTKIVCTLGPSTESVEVIKKLIKAGMNVARLNFSHGTYKNFELLINNIREASKETNTPIAIMQDLQGPKIRVGELPKDGITIKANQTVTLTTNQKYQEKPVIIPIQYKHLPKDVTKNDRILLCDGLYELKVLSKNTTEIKCKVITGGTIQSHKGINVPTASISANPITDKDKKDLIFGIKHDVDFIALSFVKNNKNIEELRSLIRAQKGKTKIIAKVERHEAVKNLAEIIHEADGVMVARGDMGVEISPEKVPLIQKRMIHLANLHGKPVITATEMLQSMIENARPTRAEVSDVANAIFDHTDAVMLSNETATGKYPVKAVQTMTNVAKLVEADMKKHEEFLPSHTAGDHLPVSYAVCTSAISLAKNIDAKLIVTFTYSGFTAQHIAKHRIHTPIVVITEDPKVQRQQQLTWGVKKVIIDKISNQNNKAQIRKLLLLNKLAKKGDKIVIVSNADQDEKLISTIVA